MSVAELGTAVREIIPEIRPRDLGKSCKPIAAQRGPKGRHGTRKHSNEFAKRKAQRIARRITRGNRK